MKYTIHNVDTGNVLILTGREAVKLFGKREWVEIKNNLLPQWVVFPVVV